MKPSKLTKPSKPSKLDTSQVTRLNRLRKATKQGQTRLVAFRWRRSTSKHRSYVWILCISEVPVAGITKPLLKDDPYRAHIFSAEVIGPTFVDAESAKYYTEALFGVILD